MKIKNFSEINLLESKNSFEEFKDVKSILKYGTRILNPEFSIMIVAYKRIDFIKDAIMSALNQKTKHRYEVVVVDNSDEGDDIYGIVNKMDDSRLSYYQNERNIGPSGNMNRCAELAGGEYFTILCDDDILLPSFVEEMLNKIELVPDCAAIGGRYNLIDENGSIVEKGYDDGNFFESKSMFKWLLVFQFTLAGSVFSRKHFLKIGGLDKLTEPGPDAVLCLRLNLAAKCYKYNKVLSHYRVWGRMGSANNEIGYEAASFVKWFTTSLGTLLHIDMYFVELNMRKIVGDYENLSKEKFKAGCDWKEFNKAIGLIPLTEQEERVYNQMKNMYLQREPIGDNGETYFIGDMAYKVSRR